MVLEFLALQQRKGERKREKGREKYRCKNKMKPLFTDNMIVHVKKSIKCKSM